MHLCTQVKRAYYDRVNLSVQGFYRSPDLDFSWSTCTGRSYNYFSYGASCSEVEVDTLTGDFSVLRTDLLMDVGDSLNPAIDIGQVRRDLPMHVLCSRACISIIEKILSLINFRRYPTTMKIKNTNIFQHRIIRTKLHFRYAEATKIKQRENLTDKYFYERKFPDLRYLQNIVRTYFFTMYTSSLCVLLQVQRSISYTF